MKDLQGKYNGDPQKVAVAYNQGEPFLNKHLKANNGQVVPDNLNKPEAVNYLKKLNDYLPMSSAHAEVVPGREPAQAPVSLASMIPGQNGQAPAYVAPQKGFFGTIADKLGISEENQMNAGNFATALSGATGAAFIPSYLPKVGLGIAGLGERIYNKFVPEAGAIGQKSIADLQAANKAAQIEKGVQGAQEAGSTLEEQDHIRKMMEASQEAQTPSKALELQNAANVRQATEAARMLEGANAARTAAAGTAGVADLSNAMAQPSSATSPTGANTAAQTQDMEDMEDPGFGALRQLQGTPTTPSISDTTKTGTKPEGGRDWNDMLLNLGLGLMAGQSPYALQNLGTAGLGALKNEQEAKKAALEERKEAALEDLQKQQGAYFQSTADFYNRGAKDKNTQLAVDELIEKELASNKTLFDPAAKNAERIRLQNMYYPHYGLNSTMPQVDTSGFKFVGSRPGP